MINEFELRHKIMNISNCVNLCSSVSMDLCKTFDESHIQRNKRPLLLSFRIFEINEHASAAIGTKLVWFVPVSKSVLGQRIFAGGEDDILALRIYEDVSAFGANGAVAANNFGFFDGFWEAEGEFDLAAMAVRLVGISGGGGHGGIVNIALLERGKTR
jgi:hypothetical protein